LWNATTETWGTDGVNSTAVEGNFLQCDTYQLGTFAVIAHPSAPEFVAMEPHNTTVTPFPTELKLEFSEAVVLDPSTAMISVYDGDSTMTVPTEAISGEGTKFLAVNTSHSAFGVFDKTNQTESAYTLTIADGAVEDVW
jgi:methionine-rich copper-binding protein CopC